MSCRIEHLTINQIPWIMKNIKPEDFVVFSKRVLLMAGLNRDLAIGDSRGLLRFNYII